MQFIAYDNKGETIDRYTIFRQGDELEGTPSQLALSLSDDPTHPLGVSAIGYAVEGDHLGKQVSFYDLPQKVREHAIERLK